MVESTVENRTAAGRGVCRRCGHDGSVHVRIGAVGLGYLWPCNECGGRCQDFEPEIWR